MAIKSELGCFQAEDSVFTITIIDDAGDPVDVEGYTCDFRAKLRFVDEYAIDVATVDVANPSTTGVLTVTLTDDETAVDPGVYEWQLFRTDDNSNAVLAYGSLYVRRSMLAEVV